MKPMFPGKSARSLAFFCGAFLALAGSAKAQIATDGFEVVNVSGNNADATGATGNPNLGIATSNWTSDNVAFTTFGGTVTGTGSATSGTALSLASATPSTDIIRWTIPVGCYQAGMNQIQFDVRNSTSSYANVALYVNGTSVASYTGINTGSWIRKTASFSTVTVAAPIVVQFVFSGGTHGAAGTTRLDNVKIFGTVTPSPSGCVGAPNGGSVSGGTTFCSSGATTLSLTGADEGCFITHQWQQSTVSATSGFADIAGATGITLSTGTVSATTYYRAYTRCASSGLADTTGAAAVIINTPPAVAAITGLNAGPLAVGSTDTLASATAGGSWSSSDNSVVTVDANGVISGISGGNATITYKVTGTAGCNGSAAINVNVAWPNTLALYAGTGGNSTGVITAVGATASPLAATGFTAATPCGSGGLSGLSVATSVTAYDPATGPRFFYVVKPVAGKALNISRIAARVRETSNGPQYAKIAYSLNGGATWIADSARTMVRTGSCGASPNSWSYGDPGMSGDVAINGITDSIIVAVFPYAPTAAGSNTQLNYLEVYGKVTDTAVCAEFANAGSVLPARVNICDSGSRWLNYDFVNGASGVGISYQWQVSTTSATAGFSDIAGATNASYNTGMLYAPATRYYRVKITCSAGGTNFSVADTVTANTIPAPVFDLPAAPFYVHIGTPADLSPYAAPAGGWWSSDDSSSTSVDSATGIANGHIPGYSRVTYHVTTGGCTGIARDSVFAIYDSTLALYMGMNGTSNTIITSPDLGAGNLSQTGYGVATNTCGRGGISSLTRPVTATAYSAAGPFVTFTVSNPGFSDVNITRINATVRKSASGPALYRIAYRTPAGSGAWSDNGNDLAVLSDDCGYSSTAEDFVLSTPVPVGGASDIEFGIQAFAPAVATGTFQVNTISVIGYDATPVMKPARAGISNVIAGNGVQLYPNPASDVLNVAAAEAVNVVVMSLDGKMLIRQNNARQINVSTLAGGMYIIKVYGAANNLLQTAKFTKQ